MDNYVYKYCIYIQLFIQRNSTLRSYNVIWFFLSMKTTSKIKNWVCLSVKKRAYFWFIKSRLSWERDSQRAFFGSPQRRSLTQRQIELSLIDCLLYNFKNMRSPWRPKPLFIGPLSSAPRWFIPSSHSPGLIGSLLFRSQHAIRFKRRQN